MTDIWQRENAGGLLDISIATSRSIRATRCLYVWYLLYVFNL